MLEMIVNIEQPVGNLGNIHRPVSYLWRCKRASTTNNYRVEFMQS